MRLIVKIIIFFCLKSVSCDIKCPFPSCYSIYSFSNFCNVQCSKIELTNRGTSQINSIQSMILNQVSFISNNIFSNLKISQLNLVNSLPNRIEKDAFKDLKIIDLMTFKSISLNKLLVFEENFIHIKNKIEVISLLDYKIISPQELNILLNASDYIEIKRLLFFNTSLNSYVDLSKMAHLEIFHLRFSQTETMIFNINRKLNEFNIQNSNLKKLTIELVEVGSRLEKLSLYSNKIERFEAKFLNLEQITLHNNSFSNLTKESFVLIDTNVLALDLEKNQINFIESNIIKDIRKVQFLNLAHNRLDHRTTFVNLSELDELDLSSNNFSRFDQELVSGCEKLQSLDLSNNNIEFFNVSLKSLLKLNLNNNRIKSIHNFKIWTVDELYLDKNQIKSIDDINLDLAKNLKILSLNYNELKSLSFELLSYFESLVRLELIGNHLYNLEFPRLRFLKTLLLDKNLLNGIDRTNFGNLIELEILSLAENKIQTVHSESFIGNSNIEYLDLSKNFLSDIPNVSILPKLKNFFLNDQNGRLTKINDYAFERQSEAIELYLSYNNITYFSPHSFCMKNSSQTGSLKLTLNSINFMPKCLLKQFNSQVKIYLRYNKIDCYLKIFINKYKYNIFSDHTNILCAEEFVDDCSEVANYKFNCSSNLNEFEITFSWFIIGQPFFTVSKQILENCVFENGILFEYKELKIFLVNCSAIKFIKDNTTIDLYEAELLNDKKELVSIFGYLKLDNFTYLFHFSNSDIYVILGSFSKIDFDYVIVYTSKFVFNRSDGYFVKVNQFLINGSTSICDDLRNFENIQEDSNLNKSSCSLNNEQKMSDYISAINRNINLLDSYTYDKSKKYSENCIDYFKRLIGTNDGTSKKINHFFLFFNFCSFCILLILY